MIVTIAPPTFRSTTKPATITAVRTPPFHRLSLAQRRQRLARLAWHVHWPALPVLPMLPRPLAHAALWFSLLVYRGPFARWSDFWDTLEIANAPADLRPALRRRAARERAAVLRTLRTIQRMPERAGGGVCCDAARWRAQVNALVATMAAQTDMRVTVEWDWWGAAHYRLAPATGYDLQIVSAASTQAAPSDGREETQAC